MYDRLKAPGGLEMMTDFFVDLQLWGTPEQVYDKIVTLQEETYMDGFMGVFSFAGMDHAESDRNMKLLLVGHARITSTGASSRTFRHSGLERCLVLTFGQRGRASRVRHSKLRRRGQGEKTLSNRR